ncbi:MAG TPA: AMP-binding protein [Acidimicrobiales bacterium]|nr:AMP-binding protein [Acidimicrobiales bacterium]
MSDVLHVIVDQARSGPALPALKDQYRELNYAELVEEVARLGTGLTARGVTVGDRVALLLPNSVDFVVAALASLWIGAIFVPLAFSDPNARLVTFVADCAPALVVTSDVEGEEPPLPPKLGDSALVAISALRSEAPAAALVDDFARVAYMIYTSGTTGTPKGVQINSAAFGAAVRATSKALGLDRATRTLCVSPFHFDGSFGTLFPTLFAGGAVVIWPRESLLFPQTFFRTIEREEITYTGFSPSYLRLLLASPHMTKLADSSLELIALGGEAGSLADVRTLWSIAPQIRVFNRYGPTETAIAVTHVLLTPELTAEGTVPLGSPHPDVSFYLVDDDGAIIEESNRTGELYIGGAQLMDGYWGAPTLTNDVLRSDVVPGETLYRTGDLVYRDRNDLYVYVDRADRVIKRSGVRISLIELGDAMRNLAGVSSAACVTFDDEGELGIVAFVVTDGAVSTLELRKAALEQLPENMLPNRIDLVDVLPLTSSGKLDERTLLLGAGLAPLRPATISDSPPSST